MPHRLDTALVHAGDRRVDGAVVTPIFQTAMYEMDDEPTYDAVRYIRLNNTPNHAVLAERLAAVTGAEAALVTGSGMSAITAALLAHLRAGDGVLAQSTVYGGTATFLAHDAPRFGIETAWVDTTRPETWEAALRPRTRVFYVETIANPLLIVPELEAVVAFAEQNGLIAIIDNTFATPVNYRPLQHGFDLELHSATKYLNGHSDVVAGVVAGSAERVHAVKLQLNHLGGSLDPHACFLLERGLKTLGLRVRRSNATALRLAEWLHAHPAVTEVRYPGLPTDASHGRARRLFGPAQGSRPASVGYGGMVAFTLQDEPTAERLFSRLQIPLHAPSLGGIESLIVRPARSTHLGMTPEERAAAGISDSLVRVSVGIEDPDDLLEDFAQALG